MMFNDQNLLAMPPMLPFGVDTQKFEADRDLIGNFGNSMLDQNHDFFQSSIPQISPRASRSGSPDFRFSSYERIFEPQVDIYTPNLINMNQFDDSKQFMMASKDDLDDT